MSITNMYIPINIATPQDKESKSPLYVYISVCRFHRNDSKIWKLYTRNNAQQYKLLEIKYICSIKITDE